MERSTRQRSSIRQVLQTSGRPLLPTEILGEAQKEVAALGVATVYRNLKLLLNAGEIRSVELPGEAPRYESVQDGHHHHFQCRSCGRVFPVHSCPDDFEQMAPKNFHVDGHALTLYGQCADCHRDKAASAAAEILKKNAGGH